MDSWKNMDSMKLGPGDISKPSYYYDTIIHIMTSVIGVNRVSLFPLWHYYDTIMTLLWHYYNIHYNIHYDTENYYDTIMTLLWHYNDTYDNFMTMLSHYYDNIITLLSPYYCTIMTLLWHHYNHYDRVSAPSLSECADNSLLSTVHSRAHCALPYTNRPADVGHQ